MLRMGRSPKPEPAEPRTQNPEPPQRAAQPQPQPAAPAPQAAQAFEPPTRSAPPPQAAPAPPTAPSAPRAVTESEALARDLRDGVVSGFIGGGTAVSGDAEFKGMLRIDGRFTGRVRSEKGSLIVSAGGVVEADIEVATARINGTVNGDIKATGRIEFGRSARVRGDIQTPALVIEEGAVFEGGCRMMPRPASEPAKAPRAVEQPRATAPVPEPKTAAARPAQTRNVHATQAAAVTSSSPEPTA